MRDWPVKGAILVLFLIDTALFVGTRLLPGESDISRIMLTMELRGKTLVEKDVELQYITSAGRSYLARYDRYAFFNEMVTVALVLNLAFILAVGLAFSMRQSDASPGIAQTGDASPNATIPTPA